MPSPRASVRDATVLLVDQDAENAFGLRVSLGKQPHLRLIEAGNLGQAMDVLVTQVVDVVVACVRTLDVDGLPLLQQVRRLEHLATLPLLMVTEDNRLSSEVKAFRHGASDYIVRPFTMAEVVARVEAAIRHHRVRSSRSRHDVRLCGDFQAIAFSDLVHLLEIGRRTGTLTLLTPRTTGQVLFVKGQIYHATFGTMEGEEAFLRVVYETCGHFEFKPGDFDLTTVRNTIALTTRTLLMEAARRLDSWRREHPEGGELPEPTRQEGPAAAAPDSVLPAVPGTASAAAELTHLIAGEACASLQLLCRDQLPAFTGAGTAAGRCLVLLVADAPTMIAVACSAAAPAGPEFVEQALAYDQKVLALRWRAPSGACLDVVLLDQEVPGCVLNELRLQPTALVVAPRGGNWFALSMLAQDELGAMIAHLRPCHLLGLGEATMEEGLRFLQQRGGSGVAVHCLPTPLQQWANLRGALQEALQLWAAMPALAPAKPAGEPALA